MDFIIIFKEIISSILDICLSLLNLNTNSNLEQIPCSVSKCLYSLYTYYNNTAIYYKNNTSLIVTIYPNCCGVSISCFKNGSMYIIKEEQKGMLCRCICPKIVVIKNAIFHENISVVYYIDYLNYQKKKMIKISIK